MRWIIEIKLKYLAKWILAKYKPAIIGITGSVGKTSAKEAIGVVLAKKFRVGKNNKNYNNEIGLPLTIIGEAAAGRSIIGWLKVFWQAFIKLIINDKDYPNLLILEMGADKPGDIEYLTGIALPQVGVVTLIGSAHLEAFGTIEKIQQEKSQLIKSLPSSGWAVLNYDDERTRHIAEVSKAKVITYGFNERAKVQAREIKFNWQDYGVNFKLGYEDSYAPVFLSGVIDNNAVYAALAAAAVGIAYGMNLVEISEALRGYLPPRGRMNIIQGIKNTIIIDDTYNSSPQAALAALETLRLWPLSAGKKKYAVLGDMLELGNFSAEGHRQVGQKAAAIGLDGLLTVGEMSLVTNQGAMQAGLAPDKAWNFANTGTASKFLQDKIREGDLILIKGSQGMRMEKIVKEIMAEPLRAEELLVRMDKAWIK